MGRSNVAPAVPAGLDRGRLTGFLAGTEAATEMLAGDRAAREAGVNGVPSFFLNRYGLFSGALPAGEMVELLRRGHHILANHAA